MTCVWQVFSCTNSQLSQSFAPLLPAVKSAVERLKWLSSESVKCELCALTLLESKSLSLSQELAERIACIEVRLEHVFEAVLSSHWKLTSSVRGGLLLKSRGWLWFGRCARADSQPGFWQGHPEAGPSILLPIQLSCLAGPSVPGSPLSRSCNLGIQVILLPIFFLLYEDIMSNGALQLPISHRHGTESIEQPQPLLLKG